MAELIDVSKRFGAKVVLDGIDLKIEPATHLGIFGENGAGKTSLARLLAGLEKPSRGRLSLEDLGRPVLVQQDFVVWPHLSVRENVSIACDGKRRGDRNWVNQWLERFDLLPMAQLPGGHLSYGQQQRLSLARAFASGASFFIFDEVFSGLDAISHLPLLLQVKACLREQNATSIWISHDWSEISMMCGRVAVLGNGKVLQSGTPETVYQNPVSLEVARMTGPVNILSPAEWALLSRLMPSALNPSIDEGERFLIRPENVSLLPGSAVGRVSLESEWFLAPGFLQLVRFDNGLSLQIFSADAWPGWDEASIELKKPPCVLS
jgi:ABC-type multidrug transport system ATPase subunit